ncbi:MAG: GNAT family N-acetyltransferase [Clostridia bacterium]|nr:GNAT family N-acetyltransferase [Clostridia bacterium]
MAVEIIKAESDKDFLDIKEYARIIWNEHYIKILTKDQIDYMTLNFQSEKYIKHQVLYEGYEYYKLSDSNTPCGYFAIKKEEKALFLSKLYLFLEHRKKGIARTVLNFILEYAKKNKLDKIYLTVNKNNKESIKVYNHLGFRVAKEEVTDIGSGFVMDDYVMELKV